MFWWRLRQLKSRDEKVRERAARKLGESRDDRAVEPLIAALNDDILSVRRAAAGALKNLDWEPADDTQRALMAVAQMHWEEAAKLRAAAVAPLLRVLKKEEAYRVEYNFDKGNAVVARALATIGTEAVKPLLGVLKNVNEHARAQAAWALGEIGDPGAVAPLVAVLTDKDSIVRNAAVEALGKIGDARAVTPLVTALKEADWDSVAAIEALGKIGDPRAVAPLLAAQRYSRFRESLAEALDKIDGGAVEPLLKALTDRDSDVRGAAANALQRRGWQPADDAQRARLAVAQMQWHEAVSLSKAAVEPLLVALKEEESEVAIVAIREKSRAEGLRSCHDPLFRLKSGVDPIQKEVIEASQSMDRARARIAHSKRVQNAAANALKEIGWCPKNEWQRVLLAIAQGQRDAIEPLVATIKKYGSGVDEAVEALGNIGDARAVKPLLVLYDQTPAGPMRKTVIQALVRIGSPAVEPLTAALTVDIDMSIPFGVTALGRVGAAEALGKIGDLRAREALLAALTDGFEYVRAAAARSLGQLGAGEIMLQTVALRDKNADVRVAAAEALKIIDHARAVELADAVCDVCSASLSRSEGTPYSADEFQRLVSKGFEPDENTLTRMMRIAGISQEQVVAQWQEFVARSETGWLLCASCAAKGDA